MALPCPAMRTNIVDSTISVGSYGWSDEFQGQKNNDVLMKRLTNTIARMGKTSSATSNSHHQQKNSNNKKEKEYSAPQPKKRKNGKEITTESRSCNLPEFWEENVRE
ncbi:unnamed protein product [Linum trigynum]|uniref:Uncharacterized protein n=1 Tax=Linum trigynum TaxID=586398 RepID=A0AAV2F7J3_9ROSI